MNNNPDDLIKRSDVIRMVETWSHNNYLNLLGENLATDINSIPAARSDKCEAVAWLLTGVNDHEGMQQVMQRKPKKVDPTWWKVEPLYLAAPQQAIPAEPLSEWLETEISAIDTMYRGSPSYTHDAYNFKQKVLDLITKHKAFIDAAPTAPIDNVRNEALEEAANIAEAIDSNRGNEKEIAKAIRALITDTQEVK
jgi:hypothetical protein